MTKSASSASASASGQAHHHRSALKQKNKPFKGTTKAKSFGSRGKIDRKTLIGSQQAIASLCKADRKNQGKLRQQTQRLALEEERRIFSGRNGVARTVAVIPLTPLGDSGSIVNALFPGINSAPSGIQYVEAFKQSLRYFLPDRCNFLEIVDAAAAADTILFIVDASCEAIDKTGVDLLEVLRGQGICTALACITGLESVAPAKIPKQNELRARWMEALTFHLGGSLHQRLFSFDHFESRNEASELLRTLCQLSVYNGLSWRDVRPYLVARSAQICSESGLLTVEGHVRGSLPFSPNQLVHIPGIGDLPMKRMTLLSPSRSVKRQAGAMTDVESVAEAYPDPESQQQVLNASAVFFEQDHDMGQEETANVLEEKSTVKPLLVRVPKGTSAYQARIIYEAGLDESEHDENDEKEPLSEAEEETELIDLNAPRPEDDKNELDEEEEDNDTMDDASGAEYFQQGEPDRRFFPEAVNVPIDESARLRFAKYRGIESLRTSQWDCCEDATTFEAFGAGALVRIELDASLLIGDYAEALLRLLRDASTAKRPFCLYGLLAHEQKMSVLNYSISSKPTSLTVSSKQTALAVCGFRRFEVSPMFSDGQFGQALHLYQREMPTQGPVMCSFVGPVTYPPAPLLLFTQNPESASSVTLFAAGSLASVKPDRLVLKRISLLAHPFKIHRKTCTARFMFTNPSDVNWFRPVGLVTSHARARGHIKESLGTHGYMKCVFDRPIQQNEQIAMHLYKRVFPKWQTRICSAAQIRLDNKCDDDGGAF
jgi:pre-rRNA-processing protein TSR1